MTSRLNVVLGIDEMEHEVEATCRLCLQRSQHLEPLFDKRSALGLVEKLQTLTQLQIAATDGWPAAVCRPCIGALNAADRFRSKCLDSHRQLETFFLTLASNSIVIKEECLDLKTAVGREEPLGMKTKMESDSVCDPLLFVNVGSFQEEADMTDGDNDPVAIDTGEGSDSETSRMSDSSFQEDFGRQKASTGETMSDEEETGRKRKRRPENWKRNIRKTSNVNGTTKTFSRVLSCCKTNLCCQKFSEEDQRGIFSKFYTLGDKNKQNRYLSGLMSRKSVAQVKLTPKSGKNRSNTWGYSLQVNGEKRPACKAMMCSLLQVHSSRIDLIKSKQVKSLSVDDMKGRHDVRPTKISKDDWALVRLHYETIPHKTRRGSSRKYFTNPHLTMYALYDKFQDFYQSVTGKELNHISFSTYQKYFHGNNDFTFQQP